MPSSSSRSSSLDRRSHNSSPGSGSRSGDANASDSNAEPQDRSGSRRRTDVARRLSRTGDQSQRHREEQTSSENEGER